MFGVQINAAVYTGPKFDKFRIALLQRLAEDQGKDYAQDHAGILCTTGLVPDPVSTPHALNESIGEPPLVKVVFAFVEALAKRVSQMPPVFSNVHVPSDTNPGFPYYESNVRGALIKRAYLDDYVTHADAIADELTRFSLSELQSSARHLPLFSAGTTGRRLQPRSVKITEWSGSTPIRTEIKPNEVHNWRGEQVSQNMHTDKPNVYTMRGRSVTGQSATVNMLAQLAFNPMRNAAYTLGIWHASDWGVALAESLQLAEAYGWNRASIVIKSTDFSRMEATMRAPIFEAYLLGLKAGGWSEAFTNLVRWIHYSPLVAPCDSKGAKRSEASARLYGSEDPERWTELDLGQHSGEFDTDLSNKIYGTCYYLVAHLDAGTVVSQHYDPEACNGHRTLVQMAEKVLDEIWPGISSAKPRRGDHAFICGNSGDDNRTIFENAQWAEKYAASLKKYAPYVDITFEATTNFLGETTDVDGQTYASKDKMLTNRVAPENGIEHRPFAAIGMLYSDQHYATNPEWTSVLRPALQDVSAQFYGVPWFEQAASLPVTAAFPEPRNAMELEFIINPDKLLYKFASGDISEQLIESTGLYLSVSLENSEYIYHKFRT